MSSSAEIQRELEQTRDRMSAELDALAYKLDVPTRAKERLSSTARRARNVAPSPQDVQQTAEENPLGIVLAGAAVGFLTGLFLPRTKVEDERIGPLADRARDQAVAAGRDALVRGKVVADEVVASAKDTAVRSAKPQAQAARRSAARRAASVASSARG